MKLRIGIISALLLFNVGARAENKNVFYKTINLRTSNKINRFFEIRGVQATAVVNAWKKCQDSKKSKCVVSSVKTEHTNLSQYDFDRDEVSYETSVSAVIKSIDHLKMVIKSKDTSKQTQYFDERPNDNEVNGVLMAAIDSAKEMCEVDGHDFCVLDDVKVFEKGTPFYDYKAGSDRFRVRTEATVSGYKIGKFINE
jgi:hypothetical protein